DPDAVVAVAVPEPLPEPLPVPFPAPVWVPDPVWVPFPPPAPSAPVDVVVVEPGAPASPPASAAGFPLAARSARTAISRTTAQAAAAIIPPLTAARCVKEPSTGTGSPPSGTTLSVNACPSAGPVRWLAVDRYRTLSGCRCPA